MAHGSDHDQSQSFLSRIFSIFAEVKPDEVVTAILLTVNVFLLLGSYYLLKTVREALILGESGAVIKSYSAAGQALLLFLVIPAYAWLSSRVSRIKLVSFSSFFFFSNLLIFWILGKGGADLGVPFYLWLGIYNNFIVAQFWGFANDLYNEEQGKRLFPIIGIGSSLGAWVGTLYAKEFFKPLGPFNMLLVGAMVLGICMVLTIVVHRRESRRDQTQQKAAVEPLSRQGAFGLVMRTPYLRYIALLILLLNVVNSTGEFLLGSFVEQQAERTFGEGNEGKDARRRFVGAFYGDFYSWVNLLGFLMQAFLASRVLKYMGVRAALFILPVIALTGYSCLLMAPVLAIVRVVKILENATDYSIMNTLRHALYLPTSRDAKYKAKATNDTFVVRIGDMAQAGIVWVGTQLAFTIQMFAGISLVFVLLWLGAAALLFREHRRITGEEPPATLPGEGAPQQA